MASQFLINGPADAPATLLFAHGAGASMDSKAMTMFAEALAAQDLRVARFEFAYMAARRDGNRKPPPRADKLIPEFLGIVDALQSDAPLCIGGKSMGGRVASMAADELFVSGAIQGLFCLGYPFHPPAKPETLRASHLQQIATPTLICQGTRDPFGTIEEVPGYDLGPQVEMFWLEDGDHDLKPRKRVTGCSAQDYADKVAVKVANWVNALV